MLYEPLNILGEIMVEEPFEFTCNLILESSEVVEEIEDIIIQIDSKWNEYIKYKINGETIIFHGEIPFDIFDRYKFNYVDKGSSDKIMEPIIVESMSDVPDFKDVYKVTPDDRRTIDVPVDFINITVKIKEISESEDDGSSSTPKYVNYTHNYQITAIHNMDKLKDWIQDYFENRYDE